MVRGLALDLAQDAVEITMATDHPNLQADSIVDLALVFEAAGSREDAATAAATALGIYRPRAMSSARGKLASCSRVL